MPRVVVYRRAFLTNVAPDPVAGDNVAHLRGVVADQRGDDGGSIHAAVALDHVRKRRGGLSVTRDMP